MISHCSSILLRYFYSYFTVYTCRCMCCFFEWSIYCKKYFAFLAWDNCIVVLVIIIMLHMFFGVSSACGKCSAGVFSVRTRAIMAFEQCTGSLNPVVTELVKSVVTPRVRERRSDAPMLVRTPAQLCTVDTNQQSGIVAHSQIGWWLRLCTTWWHWNLRGSILCYNYGFICSIHFSTTNI